MQRVALTIVLLFAAVTAAAQDCATLTGAVRKCAAYSRIDADGALLVAAEFEPNRVSILDMSTPNAPVELGHYLAANRVDDVAISGSVVLAAIGGAIEVISIVDSRNPVRVGRLTTTGSYSRVTIDGALAAAIDIELKQYDVIDVTNPAAPDVVSTVENSADADDLALAGTLLLGAAGYIERIDLSDPDVPVRLPAKFPIPEISFRHVAATPTVAVTERRDISQGTVYRLDINQIVNQELQGTEGYPSGDVEDVAVAGCRAYFLTFTDLRTIDISGCVDECATCNSTETNVCLLNGRFSVTATWRLGDGTTGSARRVNVSDDTAGFWFFGPTNTEMLFKVINGCSINNRFWVYAGGLTDVEVTLRVTDTKTNAVKTYTNPLGRAFQTITDSSAFPCP